MLCLAQIPEDRTKTLQASTYLARVVPWIEGNFVNLHWSTTKMKQDGKTPFWGGRAHNTLAEAMDTLRWVTGKADIKDIYVCMSSQATCEEKVAKAGGRTYRNAVKGTQTAVGLKALYLDLDVKEGAYATTDEALKALSRFVGETGLPRPTMAVASGSGGIHVYWVLSRVLSREEWLPLSHALVEATRRHGLMVDTQCTIDAARVLRVPGTLNWKSTPPKPVTLRVNSVQPGDYAIKALLVPLTPYMGARVLAFTGAAAMPAGAVVRKMPGLNDEFSAGIAEAIARPPVDLDSVAQICGFVSEALATSGAAFSNPLWNLTTLIATFGMGGDGKDGRAQAHRMASGHPEYTFQSTEDLYDRKLRERDEKNLGWPKCSAIQNAGCTGCATCPLFQYGKSPLHYGRDGQPARTVKGLKTPRKLLQSVGWNDLPKTPDRREPVLGSFLVRSCVAVLTAPGGVGKTSLVALAALSLSSGRDLLGMPVFHDQTRGGLRVLLMNAEDPTREINLRLRGAAQHHVVMDGQLGGLRIVGAENFGLSLLTLSKAGSSINEEHWAAFVALIDEEEPDVVILDPLYSVMGGASVNDNAVMGLFLSKLTALAAAKNISILLVHHTGKGRDLSSQDASLGAVSIVNAARIVVNLERLSTEAAKKLSVPSWVAPTCFRLRYVKANLRAPDDEACLFRTVGVRMNNAKPPVYPEGDQVGVVEVYRPQVGGPAFPHDMVRDALLAISGAQPPLNPTPQAQKNRAVPVIAQAIVPHRSGRVDEVGAGSLLSHLDTTGLVTTAEIVEAGQKSRSFKRKALVVTDAGNALLATSAPAGDAVAANPESLQFVREPTSHGFPMSSQG